jgi:flagellar hook protein FlgE
MSFQQGLSGLNATSKNLEIIGNNIANANTYGAKTSRGEFSDMYANALNGSGVNNVGIGTRLDTVAQQFTQGTITTTENPLDLAINGGGFFQVTDGRNPVSYTRNGQFKVDKDGFIANNQGERLMGYPADGAGNILPGKATALQMPTAGIDPSPTGRIEVELNLDSRSALSQPAAVAAKTAADAVAAKAVADASLSAATAALATAQANLDVAPTDIDLIKARDAAQSARDTADNAVTAAANKVTATATAATAAAAGPQIDFDDADTFNDSTSITVFDAKGQSVALTYYFQKVATDEWDVYVTANGQPLLGTSANPLPSTRMTFTGNGSAPLAPTGPVTLNVPAVTDAKGAQTMAIDGVQLDLGGAKQQASAFGVTDLSQDGYAPGQLTNITVENSGVVTARYTNGLTKPAGQIEIATFRNPQGLQPLGGNAWARTFASGDPIAGVPGEGNLGVVTSGALEESNVDLTAELVNMITAQRVYQANAQTIKTQDQVLQTLVNLR